MTSSLQAPPIPQASERPLPQERSTAGQSRTYSIMADTWPRATRLIEVVEDAIHYLVALTLLAVAAYVLYRTMHDFFGEGATFASRVIGAINGVLFVVIVMEILRTVAAHFERDGFQLRPFLIIGIISAVRHILTVGAQLSLGAEHGNTAFVHAQIELGVNAAVGLVLVVALVLLRHAGEVKGAGD